MSALSGVAALPTCVLFRMRDDVHDVIDVVLDEKIKAPIFVDAGLPEVLAFVVLLGAKRRVSQVLFQKFYLFEKSLPDTGRKVLQDRTCAPRVVSLHRERLALGTAVFFLCSRYAGANVSFVPAVSASSFDSIAGLPF